LAKIPPRTLFKTSGTTRIRWLDDGHFVYDRVDVSRPYLSYRDIYVYDIEHEKQRRLTDGARAQEPAPSPKGDSIVFVTNEAGKTSLAMIPLDEDQAPKKPKPLIKGNFQQRFSGPEFLNDDDVLFVMHTRQGPEKSTPTI